MQFRKINFFTGSIALALLVFTLTGCLKKLDPPSNDPKSYISIMHMASRAPSIEVYLNDQKASQPILSGVFSSAYSGVTPGFFDIGFRKSGSDSVVASIPSQFYDSAKYYTLLLYNDQPTSAKAIRIVDNFSVLTQAQAYYRFFHLSADAPDVDLYLNSVKVQSNRQYLDNISNTTYNGFVSYSPGSFSIEVKKAGTDSVIAQTSANMFQANAFTIFLNGLANLNGTNTIGLDVLQASN